MPSDGLLWRGLAADLRRDIASGRYPVDTKLPSIRRMRAERQVSDKTILTALAALREEGLIASRQGSGHWVIRAEPLPDVERRLANLEERVARLEADRDS